MHQPNDRHLPTAAPAAELGASGGGGSDSPTPHLHAPDLTDVPPPTRRAPAPADADAGTATADRRGPDRRRNVLDARTHTGLERRRGPGRRRSDFSKSAEDGHMSAEQFLFVAAIDAFKRVNNIPFPSWTEVLEVIRKLGYRKTAPMTLHLDNAEDWTEAPDAPAFITPPSVPTDSDTRDE